MGEIKIKGNTQIRERTVTQALHKAYTGHTVDVLHAFVVGTAAGSGNPLAAPRYGEIVLCTSTGTWNGDAVTADHYYQWQSIGWVDVGTLASGDRLLVASGSPITNTPIGDFASDANEMIEYDGSSWATSVRETPPDGEGWLAIVRGDGFWKQMTAEWAYVDGLAAYAWVPMSKWLSGSDGDGIKMVGPTGALSTTDSDENKLAIELHATHGTELVVDSDGLYHDDKLAHVIRVDVSNLSDDSKITPDGGESDGHCEQIDPAGLSPTGAWSSFDNGDIVELVSGQWVKTLDYASLASGMKARLSNGVAAAASFAGEDDKIAEWNGSNWTDNGYYDPRDGTVCIQEGSETVGSSFEDDTYIYDELVSLWIPVAQSVGVSGNALQESSGIISHVDSVGHSMEKVKYADIRSDSPNGGNDPDASGFPAGTMMIVNDWSSFTTGEVVVGDGVSTWTSVSGSQPGALVQAGTRFTTAATVAGDIVADSIMEVVTIDWVNGNTYTTITPTEGDGVFIAPAPAGTEITEKENIFQIWNGTTWDLAARPPSGLAGSGLQVDTFDSLEIDVKADAGLDITSNELHVIGRDANDNIVSANGTDKTVVLEDRFQAFMNGLHWRDPVAVLRMISDADMSGQTPSPGGPGNQPGDAYVCNNWSDVNNGTATGTFTAASKELSDSVYTFQAGDVGDFIIVKTGTNIGVHEITSINAGAAVLNNSTIVDEASVTWRQSDTYKDGSIYEYDGNGWVEIVEGVDVEPPDGTRVGVQWMGSPAGSFAGESGRIAVYDASGDSWDFTDPEDAWAIMVGGEEAEGSYYENTQWVCDTAGGTTYEWVQVGAATTYTGSKGISIVGTAISINTAMQGGIPAAGVTWTSGATLLDTSNILFMLNGKVHEYQSVIGSLAAGEFHYDSSTGVVTVSAADTFDGVNDYAKLFGFYQ